jgi:hypothetical protein
MRERWAWFGLVRLEDRELTSSSSSGRHARLSRARQRLEIAHQEPMIRKLVPQDLEQFELSRRHKLGLCQGTVPLPPLSTPFVPRTVSPFARHPRSARQVSLAASLVRPRSHPAASRNRSSRADDSETCPSRSRAVRVVASGSRLPSSRARSHPSRAIPALLAKFPLLRRLYATIPH